MAKKPGLPEGHTIKANLKGITEVADLGDFVDLEFDAPKQKPAQAPERAQEPPVAPKREAAPARPMPPRMQEEAPAAPSRATESTEPTDEPRRSGPRPATRQAEQAQPSPSWRRRGRRKEFGLDPETERMLSVLQDEGRNSSSEPALTESEIVRAAIRAVFDARNQIGYERCGRRGAWGSPSQKSLLEELSVAYSRGIYRSLQDRFDSV